jgi:hypothetical protein
MEAIFGEEAKGSSLHLEENRSDLAGIILQREVDVP